MLPLHCFNVVVQFEFEFFKFEFKLNLFESLAKERKKEKKKPLSAQNASAGPALFLSLFLSRGPTSLPRPSLARAPAHPRLPLLCRRQAGPARRIRPPPLARLCSLLLAPRCAPPLPWASARAELVSRPPAAPLRSHVPPEPRARFPLKPVTEPDSSCVRPTYAASAPLDPHTEVP